jgi:DNA-binding transcriptional regulator YdaS (Cro superfamily)
MAREIGISQTWLALLIAGTHVPSAEVCVDIEKYTNGAVTRKELRPDLFGDLR